MVKKIISQPDFQATLATAEFAVLDFYADWCGPCVTLAPIFASTSEAFEGKCAFFKADVDQAEDLASKFEVFSIPTLVFFKNGKEFFRQIGGLSKDSLVEKVNKLLS